MKLWLIEFGSTANEYSGGLSVKFDLQVIGISWFIFRAISQIDAERQADLFDKGNHPIQHDLNRICRTIRVLASESTEKAQIYFNQRYPFYTTPIILPQPDVYSLKLEAIGLESQRKIRAMTALLGESDYKQNKPWVAEIVGTDPKYKFKRSFISHQTDYRESSSSGDRGIYFCYDLTAGKVYEINDRISWKQTSRYFCRVESGQLITMSEEEVIEWLKKTGLA